MEKAFAGACVQSLFEPKNEFSLCINKSIKLILKNIEENNSDDKTTDTSIINEKQKNYLDENISILNGYLYFNRIENSINMLNTELSTIKSDFMFLSKRTICDVKKLKRIKKKNKVYKRLLEQIKKYRKRKEIYEILSIEGQKLENVSTLQNMQNKEKNEIQKLKKKIQTIENNIKLNDENIQKAIHKIDEALLTYLP
ncbi:conserved Plasmodium protein, unknown function [Plasmodium berghei]|uniref:Uncharacterized protein n=2 Tax=Plasmodium berghei TaxID=5821 RepID=A0A509AP14_PLABA|nr:conserved Plasmodium protein, unknown function [Plasmodium berghei ANKA]CXI62693.1 conserved Plasmodium protein, unknown function [Plasmodium berghei]SCM23737.1 conserved Plasmodium protein, unknown function [Plasmodium berghei]SCN26749.1 conserved Plasmodium protein, unknown function [Plasmodium berghei]SCO61071.1 conserved Plasmodium protein, unknown function [Plasmodium berghei]SCO63168.1 conserved Plasmodium protein, unknown function [Plasmodium berghei]|eukprot:XP_034422365.1 conserved Plasmodium protein, unknown function [Plasmodium berghei ANKA]